MVATGRFARACAAMAIAAGVVAAALIAGTPVAAATSATLVGGPTEATAAPNSTITLSLVVSNETNASLQEAALTVAPSTTPLRDEASLNTWLSGKGRNNPVIGQVQVPVIAPRGSVSVTVDVPASKLPQPSVWGVRGLLATYSPSGADAVTLRTTVVLLAESAPDPVQLATVLPIVGPASALGLMTAAELASSTAPGGYLSRLVNESTAANVAYALDPRITTSILTLGAQAPASASAWLAKLNSLKKPGFWLTFGDSDISGQIQAGAPTPLQPRIDDLANIPAPPAGSRWDGLNWPGWTPTLQNVAWPLANTMTDDVVSGIQVGGYAHSLVSSSNLATSAPANSAARLGALPAGVINDRASACAQALETANTVATRASATACLTAHVAVAASSSPAGSSVVVALARSMPPASGGSFANALQTLADISFARPITLDAVLAASNTPATLAAEAESSERVSSLQQVLANQNKIVAYSPVASEPSLVINPGARRAAAIVSSAWLDQPSWTTGLGENVALTSEVLSSVGIVTSSTINMVSGQARIPVVIRNDLPSAVAITVHAIPSNARIEVTENIPLTVQANSQARAYIPVTARVGSGNVTLKVSLTDNTGAAVGAVAELPVNVRADWETYGLLGLAVVFFGLLTAGIIRTLRRRSKKALAHE